MIIYSFDDGYETTCRIKASQHEDETGLLATTYNNLYTVEWYTDYDGAREAEFRTKEDAIKFAKKVNGRIYYYGY